MASALTQQQVQVLAYMDTMTPAEQAQAVRLLAQLLERPDATGARLAPPTLAAAAPGPAYKAP